MNGDVMLIAQTSPSGASATSRIATVTLSISKRTSESAGSSAGGASGTSVQARKASGRTAKMARRTRETRALTIGAM